MGNDWMIMIGRKMGRAWWKDRVKGSCGWEGGETRGRGETFVVSIW